MDIGKVLEEYDLDLDFDEPDEDLKEGSDSDSGNLIVDGDASVESSEYESEDDDEYDQYNPNSRWNTTSRTEIGFDPTSLEACLVSNQMYQDHLRDVISQLENALALNKEKQEQIQEELNSMVNPKSQSAQPAWKLYIIPKYTRVFAAPYFRDQKDFFCPKNEDFHIKLANKELDNYVFPPIIWSVKEKNYLLHCIRINARKHLMEPLMSRKENTYNGFNIMRTQILWDDTRTREDGEKEINKLEIDTERKVKEIDEEIDNIRKYSDEVLFSKKIQRRDIDWCLIANANLLAKRNETSCQLLWTHIINPLIKKTWTDEEDEKLTEMAEEIEHPDWDLISEQLGEERTSLTCFQRYLAVTDVKAQGIWTNEENEQLLSLIQKYTVNGQILWNEVFPEMEGREASKIRQHYLTVLAPELSKAPFTLEDDLLIFLLFMKFGDKFRDIQQYFPDRTTAKLRIRYINALKERDCTRFSIEDDKKIVKFGHETNYTWPKVAKLLGGKTECQVYHRYRIIQSYIPNSFQMLNDQTFNWPFITSSNGIKYLTRQKFLRNYIQLRLDYMKDHKTPKQTDALIRRCLRLAEEQSLSDKSDDKVIMPEITPDELDLLITEFQPVLRNKQIYKRKRTKKLRYKRKRVQIEDDNVIKFPLECLGIESIDEESNVLDIKMPDYKKRKSRTVNDEESEVLDNEIDKLFMKQLETLTFSKKKDFRNFLCGQKAVEYNACSNVIHKTLGIKRVLPKLGSSDESDSPESEELEEVTFVNTRRVIKRKEAQLEEMMDDIYKHCIDKSSEYETSLVKTILPPSRASLEAFHTLILDRKILGEKATSIGKISLNEVNAIMGKIDVKCLSCEEKDTATKDSSMNYQVPSTSYSNLNNTDTDNPCLKCFDLKQLREAYELMRRRYISMFFWPGLFSIVPAPSEELVNVETIEEMKKKRLPTQPVLRTPTGKIKKTRRLKTNSKHCNSYAVKARLAKKGLLLDSKNPPKKQQNTEENPDTKPKLTRKRDIPLPLRRSQRFTKPDETKEKQT